MPAKNLSDARVAWRQADALALPFDDSSFDAVACQFGAMFFSGQDQGFFSESAPVFLKPGGCFFFNVWDRIEDNEFCRRRHAGARRGLPPTTHRASWPARRTAITMRTKSAAILKAAGFSDITIDAIDHRSRAPLAARARGRLLPGHAAANRDRGARARWDWKPPPNARAKLSPRRFGSGRHRGKKFAHW